MHGQQILGLPLKRIIDAMRSGELPAVAARGKGLSAFEFDKEAVKALFARIEVDLGRECILPVELAAKQLGTQTMSVLWLLRLGYLKRVDGPTANVVRISLDSVRDFQSKWVSLTELARRFGTSRTLLNRALRTEGLRPIEAPEADRYSLTYFDARKVGQVNVEQALYRAAKYRGRDKATYQRESCRRRREAKLQSSTARL
jgi:hypothetical protein